MIDQCLSWVQPMEDLRQKIDQFRVRYNNPRTAKALIAGYILLLILPMLTAWVAAPRTEEVFLTELGKNFALVGLTIITLQFVLASRLPWIAHFYGLDMVLRFHKGMAVIAVLLLIFHPFLIAAGKSNWRLLYEIAVPWPIWLGRIALLILLVQAVTSLFQRLLLPFEKWRALHNQAVLILLLVIVHSLIVGGDLELASLRFLWVLWVLLAAAAYVYHKIYRPGQSSRRPYRVKEVINENYNVRTIVLEPPPGEPPFFYLPGQFHFLKLYRGNGRYDGEEHHFTISSSPTQEGIITSTIKESGDFTATLGETKPGDTAHIEGPYGRFSILLQASRRNLVFFAGGIGITPLMSMLRFLRDTGSERKVVLLNANRREQDIIFGEELAAMVKGKHPRLRVVHVLTRPSPAWKGEYGLIDQGMIRRLCGIDIRGMDFYLCCPPGMIKMLSRELNSLGATPDQIHSERFWL
jgi:predicted ferric reductase